MSHSTGRGLGPGLNFTSGGIFRNVPPPLHSDLRLMEQLEEDAIFPKAGPLPLPCPVLTRDPLNLAAVGKKKKKKPMRSHPGGSPATRWTVLQPPNGAQKKKIRLSFISYLSCGLHQAAGYEGHLIRPCTALWCEKALRRFDSPLLRSRKLLAIIDIGFPC